MYYTVSDFANTYTGCVKLVAGGGGMSRRINNVGILDYELDPSLKDRYLRTNFQEGQFPVRPDERTPGTPGGSKAGFTAFERPEDGGT